MGLKTRLNGKSTDNNKLYIKDTKGCVIATILLLGEASSTLDINTDEYYYLEKSNGWTSKGK